ncbi:unnamed protein product [Chrysodeixis includens]|uniref:Uncharacterized protein n=1 Tax=Chrysodeixis includens TaxID=689277 RepID=A0A9N8L381_CHRIL|nr:unnamed protein product [Chrysodeixis includens]
MTSVSTRFIVFSFLVNLLACAAARSFTGQFILEIFGNPIKDLEDTFFNLPETTTYKSEQEKNSAESDGGKSDTKMIDVPPNAVRCTSGTVMDINGVCRQPW